ncbi:MAG: hypothetical protein OXI84_01090 [bacterium]|nr:hypothetical protein [bacterium]
MIGDDRPIDPCNHNEPYLRAMKQAIYVRDLCQLIVEDSFDEWAIKYGTSEDREKHLLNMTLYALHFLQPFGVESALKAILQKEGRYSASEHRTHHLHRLFMSIQEDTKHRLTQVFFRRTRKGLPGILKRHHDDFVKWRYLEEDAANPSDLDIATFNTIIDACIDLLQVDACDCGQST